MYISISQAFELAKAKLDVTELRNNLSQANKQCADKDVDIVELTRRLDSTQHELRQLAEQKEQLAKQLDTVVARSVVLVSFAFIFKTYPLSLSDSKYTF